MSDPRVFILRNRQTAGGIQNVILTRWLCGRISTLHIAQEMLNDSVSGGMMGEARWRKDTPSISSTGRCWKYFGLRKRGEFVTDIEETDHGAACIWMTLRWVDHELKERSWKKKARGCNG